MTSDLNKLTGLNKLLDAPITRLVTDSRAVQRGDTFVAYPGERADGRQFIAQAIAQGANAVIWEADNFAWNPAWKIANFGVPDLRRQAGWLADAVYHAPSEKLWMVGITGTNGKTSTSHWIAQALNDAGKKCALIGTLGNGFADALQPSANTTPDAVRVHELLAEYLRAGAQAVAMEVSSHALEQGRVNGVRFDVAMLTNLSRDHLDYHGDMQSYAASKRKLFEIQHLKHVVLNLDDAFGAELAGQLQDAEVEVVGYGLRPLSKSPSLRSPPSQAGEMANVKNVEPSSDAALQLAERLGIRMVYGNLTEMNGQGLRITVHSSWGAAEIVSELVGRFNAENLLGALAVLLVSGIALADAVRSLSAAKAVAGRMQRVGGAGQTTVIVDYAHTPDALEKVLLALREACLDGTTSHSTRLSKDDSQVAGYEPGETVSASTEGRLICVFGCGGDRDRGKRALMGAVAEKLSDHCIVTSDNPRSENPHSIIADVISGMSGANHEAIADRAMAIQRAMSIASPRDTVLLAGKGHENYQEINGVKYPFNDVEMALHALDNWQSLRQAQDKLGCAR